MSDGRVDPRGILITRNPPELRVEWKDLLLDIVELVTQAALIIPTSGNSAPSVVSSAFSALKAVSLADSLETRAFGLFTLSLAPSIVELIPQRGKKLRDEAIEIARKISNKIEIELSRSKHRISDSFFRSPTQNTLYRALRPELALLIAEIRGDERLDIAAKIDISFSASVYRAWRTRPDYFLPIRDALEAPGRDVAQNVIDWSVYRSLLIENFRVRPVFGQNESKVALADIYVQPDATWQEKLKSHSVERTVSLRAVLLKWLRTDDVTDCVRLVFGGPGSGKSSFAKSFAAELADLDNFRPIFVEMQHISVLGDLRQSIEHRLCTELEIFSSDPLNDKDENRPFVLIFDGLDELVMPGTMAANRIADGFVVSLRALLRAVNSSSKCRMKVVVTGRTTIMQSFAKSYEIRNEAALEVQGFTVRRPDGTLADKRPEWWRKFARAYHLEGDVPRALTADALREVTNEPLLCFLLGLSGYLTADWEEAADNTNRIYERLIGEVWERKWGEGATGGAGRVGPATALQSRADFDLLMETMALAAWWGGENRVATRSSFDLALAATNAGPVWEKFKKDDGDALANLAMTFYFKRSEIDTQGFEFTHKTFSEYLVGRFLIKQFVNKIAVPLSEHDIDRGEASDRWCKFAVQASPVRGVLTFLRNQARLLSLAEVEMAIIQGQSWLSHVLDKGLPVHRKASGEFTDLVGFHRRGVANILACMSSLARAKDHNNLTDWQIKLNWKEDSSAPARMITDFVNCEGGANSQQIDLYRFDLRYSDEEEDLGLFATCLFAVEASLEYSNLSGGMFAYAYFSEADLTGAKLRGASFTRAGIADATLVNCDLSGARLEEADLGGCDLRGAILTGALLKDATIASAKMDYGWWDEVNPATFAQPPHGKPTIQLEGREIFEGDADYPDFEAIYLRKRPAAQGDEASASD